MSAEELKEIGRNLIGMPFVLSASPELLYAIIQNSDIAASPKNPEEEIEDIIITFVQPQYFVGGQRSFCESTLSSRSSRKGMPSKRSCIGCSKDLPRLKDIGTPEAEPSLEEPSETAH